MEGSKKRKLPARAARHGDGPSKKQKSAPTETPNHTTPLSPQVIEESLPTSVAAGKALPTLEEVQPDNLSNSEYQTISESGVLAESLQRSRQQWLTEGIFEKFYTKPTAKNKAQLEKDGNPPKDCMTKLGTCSITIEPHILDATMYGIKESKIVTPVQPPQQTQYRPIIQYGPPNGVIPPLQPFQAPPASVQQPLHFTKQDLNIPSGTTITNSTAITQALGSSAGTGPANGILTNGHTNGTPNPPPPVAASRNTDPVIKVLAEKAATDAELKTLMRIVANGEASPEELQKFQDHIDDLSRVLNSQQNTQISKSTVNQLPQPPSSAISMNEYTSTAPTPKTTIYTPSTQTPPPAALRSKGPVTPSKPEYVGIALEFAHGNGDRFLFPSYSILEYLPHGQVIASFLIVRKGSASDSTSYDPELDYYQPITIRLYTHQGRQLDTLGKTVKGQEEVRRYMDGVMDGMTRAEYVLLAMRLPRERKEKNLEEEKGREKELDQVAEKDGVLWRPGSSMPTNQSQTRISTGKSVERLLSEDEKYQKFVQSVAAS